MSKQKPERVIDLLTNLLLAFALAMDAFAVALAAGATIGKTNARQLFRLSFHFGLFQFLMPILGWLCGRQIESLVASFDHWIAFGLLAFIGGRMILSSFETAVKEYRNDITRGGSLVALSVATSIDALAVGFSIAVMNVSVVVPSIIIGIVAAGMTLIGMLLGERFSLRWGKRMELIGGCVLILIGARIVADHLNLFS